MHCLRLLICCALPLCFGACGPRDPESAALEELVRAGYSLSVAEYQRAAAAGDTRALGLFLECGTRIDVPLKESGRGTTALRAAVQAGQAGAVNWLLERGASVGTADNDPSMPLLQLAVASGSEAITRRLLGLPGLRSVPLEPLLRQCAAAGAAGIIDALLDADPALDLGASLRLAAEAGHLAVVDLLLQKSAVLDAADAGSGRTALMLAAANGHSGVARLLLDAGACRWHADRDLLLAADLALNNGHASLAELLWQRPSADEMEPGVTPLPPGEPPPGWQQATAPAILPAAGDGPRVLLPLRYAIVGHHSGLVRPPPPRERLELHRVRPAILPLRLLRATEDEAAFEVVGLPGPPVMARAGAAIAGTGWRVARLRIGQDLPDWAPVLVFIEPIGQPGALALVPEVTPRHGALCAVLHITGTEEWYEGHPGDVFRFTDSPASLTLKSVGQRLVEMEDEAGLFKLGLKPGS